MEFNIEADRASARLRRGVSQHTLSVGDTDATAMINGGIIDLQRLTLAIAAEAGLKIRVDGTIDGTAAWRGLMSHIGTAVDNARANTQDLVEKIQAKAIERSGGTAPVGLPGLTLTFIAGQSEWMASVGIRELGKHTNNAVAFGSTIDDAVTALAARLEVEL